MKAAWFLVMTDLLIDLFLDRFRLQVLVQRMTEGWYGLDF